MSYITPKELLEKNLMSIFNTDKDSYYVFNLGNSDYNSDYTLRIKGITYYLTSVYGVDDDSILLNFYPYFALNRI